MRPIDWIAALALLMGSLAGCLSPFNDPGPLHLEFHGWEINWPDNATIRFSVVNTKDGVITKWGAADFWPLILRYNESFSQEYAEYGIEDAPYDRIAINTIEGFPAKQSINPTLFNRSDELEGGERRNFTLTLLTQGKAQPGDHVAADIDFDYTWDGHEYFLTFSPPCPNERGELADYPGACDNYRAYRRT